MGPAPVNEKCIRPRLCGPVYEKMYPAPVFFWERLLVFQVWLPSSLPQV
jgi:hypothetical protein